MFQILVILALIMGLSLLVAKVSRSGPEKKVRYILWIVFALYLTGNLYCTAFSRELGSNGQIRLFPFATYDNLFRNPGRGEEAATLFAWFMQGSPPITALVLNIFLYYPLGYLLPALFPKIKTKHVIFVGCLCSIGTEVAQYLFKLGWCEMDDMIHNTLGTAIGAWVWLWQSKRLNAQRNANPGKGET